ncbi:hypothetical protein HY469_03590 [Candidatus Roizmanbacteria bacterium]|nr:hypothetical protein [Candidatus Roizmanbacteria bacterium]
MKKFSLHSFKFNTLKKYITAPMLLVVALLLLSSFAIVWYLFSPASGLLSKPILQVGDEVLYSEDEHYISQQNPSLSPAEITDRLIRDSVMLQSGEERNYIVLEPSVFNSMGKDMVGRAALVDEVQKKYRASAEDRLSGIVITLWFVHPGVSTGEYVARKAQAYDIIKPYYDAVLNGTMSFEEIAEELRSNTELAALDPAYETNTSFSFFTKPAPVQIVSDAAFDQHLKQLPVNTVSDLSIGQLTMSNGEAVEAVYMFGILTDRIRTEPMVFEDWLAAERARYTIIEL